LRFARDGGPARLYRAADLRDVEWRTTERVPPVRRAVGADLDQRLVYLIDAKGNLVAVDLDTRRVRAIVPGVERAALGPDGSLYLVDTANTVTQIAHRVPLRFRNPLARAPRALFATTSGTLLALPAQGDGMQVLAADRPASSVAMPAGAAAATAWGDVIAVAADDQVVLYETGSKGPPRTIDVDGHARAVLFSPSGHRLYVAQDEPKLLVIDRYTGDELHAIRLPGPATALRSDLYGAWLLVRPKGQDSTWVVDAATGRLVGSIASRWSADLPAVAPPATVVVRPGADVVGLDLSRPGFPEVGRVAGGGADLWMPLGWTPAAPKPETADSTAAPVDSTAPAPPERIYLQVSSSRNPSWASELADKIKAAGLPASVLPPGSGEDGYRVVLGPYATREAAEEAGRKVGMPSFILTAPDSAR
jgi:hypothetical protein